MKKFIALAIAVLMLAALAVPAFAATTGSTTLTYTVGEGYELTVPATLNLNTTMTGAIEVSGYNLLATNQVKVTATSETEWKLNDAAATEFELDKTEFYFTANGTQNFTVDWAEDAPSVAGTYNGTITFTGAIVLAAQ